MAEWITEAQLRQVLNSLTQALYRRPDISVKTFNMEAGGLDTACEQLLLEIFPPEIIWPHITDLPHGSVLAHTKWIFDWPLKRPSMEKRAEMIKTFLEGRVNKSIAINVIPWSGMTQFPTVLVPSLPQLLTYLSILGTCPSYSELLQALLLGSNRIADEYLSKSLDNDLVRTDSIGIEEWRRFSANDIGQPYLALYELPFVPIWFEYQGKLYNVPTSTSPQFVHTLTKGLVADLVCFLILLVAEPWLATETYPDSLPQLDLPATQVWSSGDKDWSLRPYSYFYQGNIRFSVCKSNQPRPIAPTLSFKPELGQS